MSAPRIFSAPRHCRLARRTLLALTCWLPALPLFAAEADSAALIWNLVIAFTVLVFTVASAMLPLAAWRQWPAGPWRKAAAAPLLLLLLWVALIVVARLGNPEAHGLWPLEIFAWSMLNMIYMVVIMTAKRILDKADVEQRDSD
ncbi:MAG: hypothetical protein WD396_07805 [Pseudohongiellaceae bacterium]